ncbi:pilus assembly protein [uncultured Cocleimonas sp.]|uniref:pilus assembly protein n=1 Tax=uncultured Cocleimonas sp. TaxID=1051587 RepID=UPI00261BAB0C|nr:PilC/PilY family type IV pilus protein [uncultured Cocleimonas sp.]
MRKLNKILATIIFAIFSTVSADDIDIIDSETLLNANILFVMDLSGSMKWCPGAYIRDEYCATGPTRLDELRGAFQDIIADTDFDNVNFGLSLFSGGGQGAQGSSVAHGIRYPVSPIIGTLAQDELSKTGFVHPGTAPNNSFMPDAGTYNSREYLSLFASDTSIWNAYGSTPIVDALFEAALYFRGEDVNAGKYPASDIRSAHPSTFTGAGYSTTSTTSTPSCDASTRQTCTKGSCGTSEICTATTGSTTSATDTGGCTLQTGNRAYCGTGETSCGLGSGCVSDDYTYTKYCGTSHATISSCQAAHPTWYACETYEDTSTVVNDEGFETTTTTTQVRCKEDRTYYNCDAADNYSCPTTGESCTKCPDAVTTNEPSFSGTYKSPIIEECSNNGIILLSDGGPTENTTADLIHGKIGTYAQGCQNAPSPGTNTQVYGRCGPELAKYLATEDHADGSTSVPDINGVQSVATYTVGLSLLAGSEEAEYLEEIAEDGDGTFVTANDRAGLTKAFKDAILGIAGTKGRSFAAPSYSIDTSNLLSHGNSVYVPVFDKDGVVWPGNLKKYQLIGGVLSDAAGDPAVDSSGALLSSARDMWSSVAPTDIIRSGGAANKIDADNRTILTDNGSSTSPSLISLNTSIANSEFGITGTSTADNALKSDLVKYIKGINPDDDTERFHMGDIIHSKPVQLLKADGSKYIFVGTNEGYLHAIDDSDGTEVFAYMPQDLLPNIKRQYEKNIDGGHIYGVDSPITLWIDETGSSPAEYGNGVLDPGEEAYLFFGLRRGGKHYYALNVTQPATPVLIWRKQFGTGDSWSQPVVAKLKEHNKTQTTPVLVIGGGYNEDASGNQIDGGNAVFIVDAIDSTTGGDIIWETPTAAKYAPNGSIATNDAVPSRIRVLDIDRNGSIDRLYFGDTGGNIWRADLNASVYDSDTSNDGNISEAKLYKIASLGGADAANRKFFEEPDIAVFRQKGGYVASIAIGSGDRTRPLDDSVNDKFFVVYDTEAFVEPTSTTALLLSDLIDSTAITAGVTHKGWYKNLISTTGEKVLSTAVTFQNKVMFTTFGTTSITTSTNGCSTSNTNEARLYILDLLSGNEDTNVVASSGEILGTPQIIFEGLQAENGGTCGKDDCVRKTIVRVGKAGPFALPAAGNASPVPDTLPRVYWFDNE